MAISDRGADRGRQDQDEAGPSGCTSRSNKDRRCPQGVARDGAWRHLEILGCGTNYAVTHFQNEAVGRRPYGLASTDMVSSEIPLQPNMAQPNMAERAIDTATDVSRTITDVSAGLQAAVDRLSEAIATARQPGKPLATISAITREAPLASLFVAFLFGIAVARRR